MPAHASVPATASTIPAQPAGKHIVAYYQTQFKDGKYISPRDLPDNHAGVTDINVGAFHLDVDTVNLNDDKHDDPKFDGMWKDLATVQGQGIKVHGMIGGAAQGSFQRLDQEFATYYPKLKEVIDTHKLNGVDLDVEEPMSQEGMTRLIDRLRQDYGPDFTITLTPVATALWRTPMDREKYKNADSHEIDYEKLYKERGNQISWFNVQFYNGFGSLETTWYFDQIRNRGVIPADKIVVGTTTNPDNAAQGYVDPTLVASTLRALRDKNVGGVFGWEYYNANPGGTARPWEWFRIMNNALNPNPALPTISSRSPNPS